MKRNTTKICTHCGVYSEDKQPQDYQRDQGYGYCKKCIEKHYKVLKVFTGIDPDTNEPCKLILRSIDKESYHLIDWYKANKWLQRETIFHLDITLPRMQEKFNLIETTL